MLIDLREVQTLWYGGLKPGREKAIVSMLTRLKYKFEKVIPVAGVSGVVGCTLSNQKTLFRSLDFSLPVLVMEDDCRITKWYNPIIEVPDDADAVYIGTTIRGLTKNWKDKNFKVDPVWHGTPKIIKKFKQVLKISNILTTHCILFLTEKYIKHCLNLTINREIDDMPVDILYASNMRDFNVYAVKRPLFYQECECNYTKNDTLTPLETLI